VLISNTQFSLLYSASVAVPEKVEDRLYQKGWGVVHKRNQSLDFEQVITIKSARDLLMINQSQLCAVSNTQIVIFNRDPEECKDL